MSSVCPSCLRYYPCICVLRARAVLAAVAAAAGLVLAGCGAGAGPHGTVTGKEYEPAKTTWRTEMKFKQQCTSRTRRAGTTTSTYQDCRTVPDGTRRVADYRPECWELDLDSGDDVCVSEDVWRRTAVGDEYPGR
ncbi:hypothetical protein [Streptomyces sp. NPDC055058]